MKKILYIDCTLREESRTRILATEFIKAIQSEHELITLKLSELDLKPLINDFYLERENLLFQQQLNHPRFDYAHQLADADEVIIAAPFWDLSFPSLLKIYIENCCVDRITFASNEKGLIGLCKANHLVYLTTRGGFYTDHPHEQAFPYLKSMSEFWGIKEFIGLGADGMDVVGFDGPQELQNTIELAKKLATKL